MHKAHDCPLPCQRRNKCLGTWQHVATTWLTLADVNVLFPDKIFPTHEHKQGFCSCRWLFDSVSGSACGLTYRFVKMKGLMQDYQLLVTNILDYAAKWHGEQVRNILCFIHNVRLQSCRENFSIKETRSTHGVL